MLAEQQCVPCTVQVNRLTAHRCRPADAAAVAIGKQEKKVRKKGAGSGKKAAAAAPAAASRPTSASPHGPAASGAPMDMSGEGSRAEGMDDSEPPKVPVKAKSLEVSLLRFVAGSHCVMPTGVEQCCSIMCDIAGVHYGA